MTNRGRTLRPVVTVTAVAGLVAALAAPAVGTSAAAGTSPGHESVSESASASVSLGPTGSALSLRSVTHRAVGHASGGHAQVELGTFLVAGSDPFEVRFTRDPSYDTPVIGHVVVGEPDSAQNGEHDDVRLGKRFVDGWAGLQDFLHLRVRDADGTLVVNRLKNYCSGGQSVRSAPDSPDTSPYATLYGCHFHPFTLGSVLGIQAGWAVPAFSEYGIRLPLHRGRYRVTMTVDSRFRDLLGMTTDDAVETVRLRVVHGGDDCRGCRTTPHRASGGTPRPAAHEPAGDVARVPGTPLPDLQSLPSTGIRVRGHYLTFGATVWNAGPSTLVVDGFRRPDENVMDSYQYFYDVDGDPAGHQKVGTMVWDPRSGHHHWHFKDFARYRLLDADKQAIVRSKKEAFCLAATDAVDYTVPGANWEPWNTDLATACGGYSSLAVREVLDVGSGDTYSQYRPGQSFDLDGLADGIYFISTEANPDHNLLEEDLTNNVALRRIRIGTAAGGQRTVKVFDVGRVHTH